jgi:hypothetical protein
MNLISERKAAREQSKQRRDALDGALSERVLKNALSGVKMEGTAMIGAERDNQNYTTDELTNNENLKQSAAAKFRKLRADQYASKVESQKALHDAKVGAWQAVGDVGVLALSKSGGAK